MILIGTMRAFGLERVEVSEHDILWGAALAAAEPGKQVIYDPRVSRYLLIAGFGAAGAASRYAVDSWVSELTGGQFPGGR